MTRAFVALGSSIEPAARLTAAAHALKQRFPGARFSACYRNAAFGFEGAEFINAVVELSTDLPVPGLLAVLHEIEAQCGRRPDDPRWGPRAMDLDLLLYDDLVASGPGYTLPRPDLLERVYMLGPLAELAPQQRHPLTGARFAALWDAYPRSAHVMTPTPPDLNAA
jgi:2-amino-4-hydroxy-6-hydroxymethyldihydropteridine diphosphokinase